MKIRSHEQQLRELDAWICENIFGHKVNWEDGRRKHGPGWLWFDKGPPVQCEKVLHYSTDPTAAMAVMEKCADFDGITVFPKSAAVPLWSVVNGGNIAGRGETLPLAICRFAKALFESEGKK